MTENLQLASTLGTTRVRQRGWMSARGRRLRGALCVAGMVSGLGVAANATEFVPLPERPIISPVMQCAALVAMDFSAVAEGPARVLSATIEPAHDDRAEFCLVKGYVAPTIQFELRLPTTTYTGRYLQTGCGGNCGVVRTSVSPACDGPVAFRGGFAVGAEDSGHVGADFGDAVWSLGGEDVKIDFAYRAAHAFSRAAKAIVHAYYGRDPDFAYFQGCSDGGREGLEEVQRYPDDFNGVAAGAPPNIITEAMERFLWEARWGHDETGHAVFDSEALALLHRAVMDACDSMDGVKDGQIDDPRRCHYDPGTLLCRGQRAAPACLTPAQVTAARRFYDGPVDEAGHHLYPGGEPYGSELTWTGGGALSEAGLKMAAQNVRLMTFQSTQSEADFARAWKFDATTFRELRQRGALFDADNPDLHRFAERGGRLLIWSGAADQAAGVYSVPDYYQRVQDRSGGLEAARRFVRLFEIPGLAHCGGGYIPYQFDVLGALVSWVETHAAPDSIVASATLASGAQRSRPIFAYPAHARYSGQGDINDQHSFVSEMPKAPIDDRYDWLGADKPPL